jgi:hypothetical protein
MELDQCSRGGGGGANENEDISSPTRAVVRAVGVDHGGVWRYVRLQHLLQGNTDVAGLRSEDANMISFLSRPSAAVLASCLGSSATSL